MNYHLHHEGKDWGILAAEDLQRRFQSGELTGAEYIWCEGMTDWQRLDAVFQKAPAAPFQRAMAAPPPLPPGPAAPKTIKGGVVAAIVIGAVICGSMAVWAVFRAVKKVTNVAAIRQALAAQPPENISGKPVRWPTNSATEADARRRNASFRQRQWLDGFRENGRHDRPVDAEAMQMLQAWLEANFGDPGTNGPNLAEWCDRLAAMPDCDDPLVLTIAAINSSEGHEKDRRLDRALAAFPQSRHKAYPKMAAAINRVYSLGNDTNRVGKVFSSALTWMNHSFSDGSFQPEDQPEIADIFINGWGYNFFYRGRTAIYPMPRMLAKGFDWLALVFEGEYHVIEAWKARGSGMADTVTEQGWLGFSNHLAAARKSFTAAWKLRPDLPLAPSRMIYVALGDSGLEEMRDWFDRTVAAQVDYPRAWSEMRWGLRPRWYGTLDAMLAFGKSAVETGRFDTDVPRKFFDVISDIEQEMQTGPGKHIYGQPNVWPHLSRMYEGYIAAETGRRDGWRSTYAAVAHIAGKDDVSRAQLEALNWQPYPGQLAGWGRDLTLMPLEVAARTGPAQAKILVAEQAYRTGAPSDALQRYKELANAPELDTRTGAFVKHRVAALNIETLLQQGDWVDLLPAGTNDPAWVVSCGAVRNAPDGALEVESGKFGHMLYSRARVGVNFEIRGSFTVLKTSNDDFQAGLVMGLPNYNASDWYGFRMKHNRQEGEVASFAYGWGTRQVSQPAKLNRGSANPFEFQFRNGKATASINGNKVLRNAQVSRTDPGPADEFLVGLGAYNDMNETVIHYDHIQVRKLAAANVAPEK